MILTALLVFLALINNQSLITKKSLFVIYVGHFATVMRIGYQIRDFPCTFRFTYKGKFWFMALYVWLIFVGMVHNVKKNEQEICI